MANELTTQNEPTIDWQGVFESLGDSEDSLRKSKVAHRIACGMTWEDAAQQVGVTRAAIAGWMKDDTNFRAAVQLIRDNLVSFIDSRMHIRFAQADGYADFILSTNPLDLPISDNLKKELLKERGLMARKIFDIAEGNKKRGDAPTLNLTQMQMTLNITPEAAKILLKRNPEINEVIDGEATVTE